MATSRENIISLELLSMNNEEVIQHLNKLFGKNLDVEVIHSIAFNYNYNLAQCLTTLSEISRNVDRHYPSPQYQQTNHKNNIAPVQSYSSMMSKPPKENNAAAQPVAGNSTTENPHAMKTIQNLRKSKKEQEFDRVVSQVRRGSRILILMRGLPGSGKSYLARKIISDCLESQDFHTFIFSTDDYFINKFGIYKYDVARLSDAHRWNQIRANNSMQQGISPVIIDNTNTQLWEMQQYTKAAINYGYSIEILEPFTPWAFNERELARRNSHGVPRVKISEMLERYEKNITPNKLVHANSYAIYNRPPVPRNYPPLADHLLLSNNVPVSSSPTPKFIPHRKKSCPLPGNGKNVDHLLLSDTDPVSSNPTPKKLIPRFKETCSLLRNGENVDLMNFEHVISPSAQSTHSTFESSASDHCSSPFDSILINTNSSNILAPNVHSPHERRNSGSASIAFEPTGPENDKAWNSDQWKPSTSKLPSLLYVTEKIPTPNPIELNEAHNLYPKLNLASWGLPDDAVENWEAWDVVRPLNYAQESKRVERLSGKKPESTFIKTSDSTTNTSSCDFALLNNPRSDCGNFKTLAPRNRDINEGACFRLPMSPSRKTLLDKSSMTTDEIFVTRERDSNDEKQLSELISFFPSIPIDFLSDVYHKCQRDLNWTVDLLLDDNKELLLNFKKPEDSKTDKKEETETDGKEDDSNWGQINTDYDKKSVSVEEKQEIKRFLEENIKINNDHYSEHVLKIKNQRLGITNQPTTSKASNVDICSNNTTDADWEIFEPDVYWSESDEEEIMELNLGEGVVSQLESKFGFPETFPMGFLPVIHVPISLARQLHALYVESVLVQMGNQNQVLEMIVTEDEEFAQKLYLQELRDEERHSPKTLNFQKIMDEQVAHKLYEQEVNEWIKLTPDTLAAKLTLQKLCSSFPTMDKFVLMEILHAHGNSYQQTVEVLLDSIQQEYVNDPDGTIREPPIAESVVEELKVDEEETRKSIDKPDTQKSANQYREEACTHHTKHKELMLKAQQAYKQKQYAIAQFYSELAKTHTRLYDQANNLAASAFLQEHSKRLQSFNTLDLHYLYVKEAIAALDIFIDKNIYLLQDTHKGSECLFVITGRGKRSDQGKSRIKPAVIGRLKKRNIWFVEVNPGLLKIRVSPNSVVTSSVG